MTATVSSLVLRVDPRSAELDERSARVTERIRGVRARTRVLSGHIAELTRQFLDDDLVEQSGPDQGKPLGREGRIEWLVRLAQLHRSYCAASEEEAELQALRCRLDESVAGATPRQAEPGTLPSATRPPA